MKISVIILSCFISSFMFAQDSKVGFVQESKVEFYGGLDNSFRNYIYSGDDDDLKMIIQSHDKEKSIISFHAGANLTFRTKNKITPFIGFGYALMGYKYEIKGSEIRWPGEVKDGVYTPDPNLPHDDIKIVHGYSYIELPIGIRYDLGHSKWSYYGELGLSPQLLLNKTRANGFGSKVNFALNLGFGFTRSINERWDMFLKPNFAIQLFSIGGSAPIKEHLYRYGLEFGVSKKL